MKNMSKREKLYNSRERRGFTWRPRQKWVEKRRREAGREIHRQKETWSFRGREKIEKDKKIIRQRKSERTRERKTAETQ